MRGWELQHDGEGEIDILFRGRQRNVEGDLDAAQRWLRRHAEPAEDGLIHYVEVEEDGYRQKRTLRPK